MKVAVSMKREDSAPGPRGSKPGAVSPARKTRVPGTRALICQATEPAPTRPFRHGLDAA